eukprot:8203359-Pyramimonas_sp.AAC.1
MQVLVRFLSINGQFEEVSTCPMLSALRPDRTPNAYGSYHLTTCEETSFDLARMFHAIDLPQKMCMLHCQTLIVFPLCKFLKQVGSYHHIKAHQSPQYL